MTTNSLPPGVPTKINFVAALSIHVPAPGTSGGRVMEYGMELDVTPELYELSKDRINRSWLDDLSDSAQIARWKEIKIRIGSWPEGEPRVQPGSLEWWTQYDVKRAEAFAIVDEVQQAKMLGLIAQVYGQPTTSRTLRHYVGPNDRSVG